MKIRIFLLLAALALPQLSFAQELFSSTSSFLNVPNRGSAGTEYSQWDYFFVPYTTDPENPDDTNHPDTEAASMPTLSQTLDPAAIRTGGFNIYSITGAIGFLVNNDTSGTIGTLGSVVFQFETLGTLIDYSTLLLNYDGGTIAPVNMISENRFISGGFGGLTNRVAVQWDLTGLNINDYSITFQSLGSHTSFSTAILDTANSFSEIVPSARAWEGGGGNNNWSTAANWADDTMTTPGGNVTFGPATGSSVNLDSNREVGLLTINQEGTFALTRTNSSTLSINTGITANPAAPSEMEISAPIFMGGHNIMNIGENATLTLSGTISGAPAIGLEFPAAGIYKQGEGSLILSGNNTFIGSVTIEGGRMLITGTNQYTGATTIGGGELAVRGNVVSGVAGVLGNATSAIALGLDAGINGPLPEAILAIEGDYTIGRSLTVAPGTNAKTLLARNTTSTGATYTGAITLSATSANFSLRTEEATDVLRIAGNISGGNGTVKITKSGSGTVIYSGSNKTYNAATIVAEGTLIIASGTVTGNGSMTVDNGAHLRVDSRLSGTGAVILNGTLSGTGTVARTVTTGGILSMIEAGNSPGTLTLAALNAASGVTLNWEVGDLINVTGLLTGSTLADGLQLNFLDIGNLEEGVTYTIFNYGSLSGLEAADFKILNSALVLNESFGNNSGWNIDGGSIQVQFSAVPEPSTYAMLALGGLVLFMAFRRRQKLS